MFRTYRIHFFELTLFPLSPNQSIRPISSSSQLVFVCEGPIEEKPLFIYEMTTNQSGITKRCRNVSTDSDGRIVSGQMQAGSRVSRPPQGT
jgi:hypothetical protein